jgi:hypothetical protein
MQMLWRGVKAIGTLLGVFCIGTVISEVLIVSYLVWHWGIDGNRVQEILRVARGQPPSQPTLPQPPTAELLQEGPSYEEFLSRRLRAARDLELRQMQLQAAEATLLTQWQKLQAEQSALRQKEMQLDQKLAQIQDQTRAAARETIRGILESLRPEQAKAQLQAMTERGDWDEAVAILTEMPASRRSRILGEFKTPQEKAVLSELLRRIQEGSSGQTQTAAGSPPVTQPAGG